ncbi:hypothetical protein [Ammoniphilus sp. 3BR4]|uniref:hypothetical protein n=1 Tax=Ammoniphilus sp. 3BR4 TaxID=3158265 RepID=UPI003467882A
MDEISAETLAMLVGKKVKLEVKGSVMTGMLLSVQGNQVMIKLMSKAGQSKSSERAISIDDIDAVIFKSGSKKVAY